MVPFLMHFFRSSIEGSLPSIYAISRSSSCSIAVSTSCSLYSSTMSLISSGISVTSKFSGRPESSHTCAFLSNKSTTPEKLSSTPIGRHITSGFAPKTFFTCSTTLKKSAPTLSSLFTKMILETSESLA